MRGLLRNGVAVLGVAVLSAMAAATASAAPPENFVDETVLTGLVYPTNVEFAADGRVFVAEKRGTIKIYDSIDDPSPDTFADLTDRVQDYWDRGLLGLALHPDFPAQPYLYVLYTFGVPLDPSLPTWGDECPNPPGGAIDGCVVSGRLSRLPVDGSQWTGVEEELIHDWCQQYPSHSIGDLKFGADGALYVSAGDGASFSFTDYGQGGGSPDSPTPVNPCKDPPNQGGALRSQDLRTPFHPVTNPNDPTTLDGTVIRIDPETGDALPDNPLYGAHDENERRIVAYGLRNPFRFTLHPETGALFIGDVGWNTWEEVNMHPNPTGNVLNFGWPCYEGGNGTSISQPQYANANLAICQSLYSAPPGTVTPPMFAYRHIHDITGADNCPPANPPQPTSSSITGLAFYEGGGYPGIYNGALFGADYSRNCIWVMYADEWGNPDPATVEVFQSNATGPVDLQVGPGGDIYYVSFYGHRIRRFRFIGGNTPPVAVIDAKPDPPSGPAPLVVEFDGSGSWDPDGDPIDEYAWDCNGDGTFDKTEPVVTCTYGPGSYTARLRVTDSRGETGMTTAVVHASNTAPTAEINSPMPTLEWRVGKKIEFSGRGHDPEEGTLPNSALTWHVILHHCETDGSCHEHLVQTFQGVATGSFDAPDHEYPSHLELRLTVADQYGVTDTTSRLLQPKLVELTFDTDPSGFEVSFFGQPATAPFTTTWIVGATFEFATAAVQQRNGKEWTFQSWSNGGARTQTLNAPASKTTYIAEFGTGAQPPPPPPPPPSPAPTPSPPPSPPSGSVGTFTDTGESIFKTAIEWLAAEKITLGCNPPANDRFCPDDFVTRGQMAAFFARAFKWTNAGGGGLFVDARGSTFERDIDLMGAAGVTRGCNPPADDRFCPDEFVTRGQMAAFFVRAFGWTDAGKGDLFVDDDGSTFERSIDILGTKGVTKGCNPPANDRFCPNDFVTRAQMAAFFNRAFDVEGGRN